MRELKITTIKDVVYLYPIPVLKENKYLVRCESIQKAHELIDDISNHKTSHPDNPHEHFQVVALHTDQQTKIFEKI